MSATDVDELSGEDAAPADLPPFAALVAALADIDATTDDPTTDDADRSFDDGATLDVERVTLDLRIELAVRDAGDGRARIVASTPTQWTATTIMPVFHRLKVSVEREQDG